MQMKLLNTNGNGNNNNNRKRMLLGKIQLCYVQVVFNFVAKVPVCTLLVLISSHVLSFFQNDTGS